MKSAAEDDMNESPKAEKPGAYAALRIRNFRFLLTGTVFVNAATWTQVVAMSWLVYHLTESGTILGSINLLRSLASISIIPLAGLLIDKYDRKKNATAAQLLALPAQFRAGNHPAFRPL